MGHSAKVRRRTGEGKHLDQSRLSAWRGSSARNPAIEQAHTPAPPSPRHKLAPEESFLLETESGLELDHSTSQAGQCSLEVAGIGEIRIALAAGLEWRQII